MSAGQPAALVAGVDEVGRGPLAGPVTAAAVVLDPRRPLRGLADSKRLDARRREVLARRIEDRALAWAVAWCDPAEIDLLNILQASLLAMRRALAGLRLYPGRVEVDGLHCPALVQGMDCSVTAIVGGDGKRRAISAASILAKVHRDAVMCRLHELYPQYGFDLHKGYATPVHLRALAAHGPCAVHRLSFSPLRQPVLPLEEVSRP